MGGKEGKEGLMAAQSVASVLPAPCWEFITQEVPQIVISRSNSKYFPFPWARSLYATYYLLLTADY